MSAINFIGIGLALFLSFLLIQKKKKGTFDFILLTWLVLNAILLFFYHLNFEGRTDQWVPVLIAMSLIPFLLSPLLFIYVSSLVQGERFSWFKQLIHFVPFIMMVLSMWWFYWLPSDNHVIKVSNGYINVKGQIPFHVKHWSLIMAFSAFIYPILCLIKILLHQSIIVNEFSSLKEKTLNWMKYWIVIEFIGFWISFLIIIAGDMDIVDIITSFKIISTLIITNVFVIGYFGVKQSNIFIGTQDGSFSRQESKEKYRHSNLSHLASDELVHELNNKMRSEKLYRNPTLSANQVSEFLGITKHQLSELINKNTSGNFYEYVNQFRIEEFKERVKGGEADNLSLLGLAFDCGFNSKSTFNHLFKKSEGITPSQFRKQCFQ
ncbi:helix-turn-helix domain-containing protein [Reichenbachiella sp.]|uniref:helix-turn-helix domain-containing protein n=1 Tax=Reichenbachiella sp. TaxID=2184521 RepID=UPI003B59E96F